MVLSLSACNPPRTARKDPVTGTATGTVWWVTSPAAGLKNPSNRRPAVAMYVEVWTATRSGMVSQAGEEPRPSYALGKVQEKVLTDDQGKFALKLRPGRYFLRALDERVMPLSTPMVEIRADTIRETDLHVTGAI